MHVPVGLVGLEIVAVGVVAVAGHQSESGDEQVAPEDQVVLQVQEVGVGDELLEFGQGSAGPEEQSDEQSIHKVFIEKLVGGEVGAILGEDDCVDDR